MPKFVIEPHFRLQEWVAEEKGYFAQEGLDYEFRESIGTRDAKRQNLGDRVGAYQTIERGRQAGRRIHPLVERSKAAAPQRHHQQVGIFLGVLDDQNPQGLSLRCDL